MLGGGVGMRTMVSLKLGKGELSETSATNHSAWRKRMFPKPDQSQESEGKGKNINSEQIAKQGGREVRESEKKEDQKGPRR